VSVNGLKEFCGIERKIMTSPRIQALKNKLERNKIRVLAAFVNLPDDGWEKAVYENPDPWTMRDLLAHFVSAERMLLTLAKDIAAGGKGAPADFNYDEFNRTEREVYRSHAPAELLQMFIQSRDSTLEWMNGLNEEQLDRKGLHPALGEVTLEDLLAAVHGHILLHLREL
jgi:hypothetical protein